MSKSTYIWDVSDDIQEDTHEIIEQSIHSSNKKSSQLDDYLTTEINNTFTTTPSRQSYTTSQSIDIQNAVTGLQSKIDGLTNEHKRLLDECKALQGDYERITTARTRKSDRLINQWEEKVNSTKAEFIEALNKQKELETKLSDNVKEIRLKFENLSEKLDSFDVSARDSIDIALKECQRKISRYRKQWEAEDKIALEKAVNSKSNSLQKQAMDFHGPRMDELAKELKESLLKRRQEKELLLESLESSLTLEADKRIDSDLERLKNEFNEIDERKILIIKQRIIDIEKKGSEELNQVRERHSTRMRELQDKLDRTRRLDSNRHLETNRSAKESEKQLINDLIVANVKEISLLTTRNNEKLLEITENMRLELHRFEAECKDRVSRQLNSSEHHLRDRLTAQIDRETEAMLTKIREDISLERESKAKEARNEEEIVTREYEDKKKIIMNSFDSVSEHLSQLRQSQLDAENKQLVLEEEVKRLESQLSQRTIVLNETRSRLYRLNSQLEEINSSSNESITHIKTIKTHELNECRIKLSDAERSLRVTEMSVRNKTIEDEKNRNNSIERIKGKIARLVDAKDRVINEHKQILVTLQETSLSLEQQIESERELVLSANISMTVDDKSKTTRQVDNDRYKSKRK